MDDLNGKVCTERGSLTAVQSQIVHCRRGVFGIREALKVRMRDIWDQAGSFLTKEKQGLFDWTNHQTVARWYSRVTTEFDVGQKMTIQFRRIGSVDI